MNKDNISKFLSYVLRHKPESIGLSMDKYGWVDIDELIIKSKDIVLNKNIIKEVVESSDKQRFSIEGNKIRANQGHSFKVDLQLSPKKPPQKLYHGTATRFLESIELNGILPQSRQYVHLSDNIETAINVAKRHGKPAIIEIDTIKMYENGYIFYLSDNGVWLSKEIPYQYCQLVNLANN
jgi:putative RNA 2'-phosphotransferase